MWKKAEEKSCKLYYINIEDTTTNSEDGEDQKLALLSNQKLLDKVMIWMLEIFLILLTRPYLIAKEEHIQNRANTQLERVIQSKHDNNLAKK